MTRPARFLFGLALALLVACDQTPSHPIGFTGGGFNPPGGFVPRGGLSPQGGGFVLFPWFRLDGGGIDASIDAAPSWAIDATSGIAVPASATEWSAFIAAKGLSISVPSSLWLMQESSGNLSDSIGSLTLTANGTPLYQQSVTGWTRKGVGFNEGVAQRFAAASGVGPSPATTSQTWLWLCAITSTPSATRMIATVSTAATSFDARYLSTGHVRAQIAGTNADGTGAPTGAGVMPFALKYNRTGSESKVFTGQEKLAPIYSASVGDGFKGVGGGTTNAITGQCVYGAMWSGTAGEISDADLKALLVAMGESIPWS